MWLSTFTTYVQVGTAITWSLYSCVTIKLMITKNAARLLGISMTMMMHQCNAEHIAR